MRRISLKTILCVVFCAGIGVCLSVCAPPLDLGAYVDDDEVINIIDINDGTVHLTADSEAYLEEGNKRITKLIPGKYYMVEEWETREAVLKEKPKTIQFVTSSGARSSLSDIGRIPSEGEKEITGLTNRYYYKVTEAKPLLKENDLMHYEILTSPSVTHSVPHTNGVITLPSPEDEDSTFVYTLHHYSNGLFDPPFTPPFDIAEVPISPASHTRSANRSNGKIITLISKDTALDYVFFGASEGYVLNEGFCFLSVTTEPGEPPPTGPVLTITIVPYVHPTEQSFSFSPANAEFTQTAAISGLNINVTVTTTPFDSIGGWYYGANQLTTGAALTNAVIGTLVDFTVIGKYEFTFVGVKGGVAYSGTYTITIKDDVD